MKLLNDNRLWKVIAVAVPMVMVLVMLIPGSYTYNTSADGETYITHFSSYLLAEPIMAVLVWITLAHAVYALAFALWGVLKERNTAVYVFLCCVVLAYLFPINTQGIEREGWLPFVPVVLCVLSPAAVFLEWTLRADTTDRARRRWGVTWNIVTILACLLVLIMMFSRDVHLEYYVVDGMHKLHKGTFFTNTSSQPNVYYVCVVPCVMLIAAVFGAVLKKNSAPLVLVCAVVSLVWLMTIDARETAGFWHFEQHYSMLLAVMMSALLSLAGKAGGNAVFMDEEGEEYENSGQ